MKSTTNNNFHKRKIQHHDLFLELGEAWLPRGRLRIQETILEWDGRRRRRIDSDDVIITHSRFRYNDHHFHYGYFLYAAAAFGKDANASSSENLQWLRADAARYDAILSLARDVANPSTEDRYFPVGIFPFSSVFFPLSSILFTSPSLLFCFPSLSVTLSLIFSSSLPFFFLPFRSLLLFPFSFAFPSLASFLFFFAPYLFPFTPRLFPLGVLTCLTGCSSSGLVRGTFVGAGNQHFHEWVRQRVLL